MKASIKAISYYLPPDTYTNVDYFNDFPELVNNTNIARLGISERHIVAPHTTASDLAVQSAIKLFEEHNIDKNDIDFIIFCSQEFDYYTPATACIIQEKLGIPQQAGAIDINQGCSGYAYGLSLAKGLVEACERKNVLFLTSSTLTKTFHPKDKSSRYLFGDGAAATLISAGDESGIGSFVFGTDGKGADKIIIRDGGARNPVTAKSTQENRDDYGNITSDANFYMNGTAIFNFALRKVPLMISELLEKSNMKMEEIDLFVFHQTNRFMNDVIRKKIGIPEEKFVNYLESCGNTVSSTIPIALCESIRSGKAQKGQYILLAGFGTGLSWSATIIKL
ncbi:MAG: hypothetical protein JWP12_3733 [Bacteroidetes bacterium]|nr:hypothetical protein [Bacteroidota bacterium]